MLRKEKTPQKKMSAHIATTTAGLSGTPTLASAEGVGVGNTGDGKPYDIDAVGITGTAAGNFADKHVGTNKTITISGLSTSLGQAADYSLTMPALTANITTAALTLSAIEDSKIYDATVASSATPSSAIQAFSTGPAASPVHCLFWESLASSRLALFAAAWFSSSW